MKYLSKLISVALCSMFFISCAESETFSNEQYLKKLSNTLIETLNKEGIKTDFTKESIKDVEAWLGNQEKKKQKELINQVGAYLGESIIKSYGGTWENQSGNWGIKLRDDNYVFPIGKVYKFVYDGPEDSFYSLFTMIPIVFKMDVETNI